VTAYGEKQKKWAPGLATHTGSHPDKGANFKEFINHISQKTYTDSDFTSAGVDLDDPDPEKATKFLLANGGSGQVQAQLLRPMPQGTKYWTYVAKARKVMEKCMYTPFLLLRLQHRTPVDPFSMLINLTAYTKMQNDNKPTTVLDGNKDKILTCLDEVAVVRGSDVLSTQPNVPANKAKGLIKDMPTLIPGATLKLDSTTWKWDSSRTIYSANLADTVSGSTAGVFADTAAVQQAVRDYGRVYATPMYEQHVTHTLTSYHPI
jgi:hypothetical protein